jgi:hypothetical protein
MTRKVDMTGNTLYVDGVVSTGTEQIVALTASATLTKEEHGGRIITLSKADGMTVTLPAATGSGTVYRFVVITASTSNAYKISAGTSKFMGTAFMDDGDGESANGWTSSFASNDFINLGGTSNATGGAQGAYVQITDIGTGAYHALVFDSQSGTEATPFADS